MRVIILGATGMVGQGVLRDCLIDTNVQNVLSAGKNATGQHKKIHELVQGLFYRSMVSNRKRKCISLL